MAARIASAIFFLNGLQTIPRAWLRPGDPIFDAGTLFLDTPTSYLIILLALTFPRRVGPAWLLPAVGGVSLALFLVTLPAESARLTPVSLSVPGPRFEPFGYTTTGMVNAVAYASAILAGLAAVRSGATRELRAAGSFLVLPFADRGVNLYLKAIFEGQSFVPVQYVVAEAVVVLLAFVAYGVAIAKAARGSILATPGLRLLLLTLPLDALVALYRGRLPDDLSNAVYFADLALLRPLAIGYALGRGEFGRLPRGMGGLPAVVAGLGAAGGVALVVGLLASSLPLWLALVTGLPGVVAAVAATWLAWKRAQAWEAGPGEWAVGTLVQGRYRIERVRGSGQSSVVYRARDLLRRRTVALKRLRETSPAARDRALDEAAEGAFRHPNVVGVLGVLDLPAGPGVIVLEYVDGPSLEERLAAGSLPLDEAARMFKDVAKGLAAFHDRGRVHCDVKPANILLAPDGTWRVADLGLAREAALVSSADSATTRSTMGAFPTGTPLYSSPRRLRGEAPIPQDDVYALVAILYEALHGRPPVGGEGAALVDAILGAKRAPSADPRLRAFFERGLAVSGGFVSTSEAVEALRAALAALPAATERAAPV